MSLGTWYTRPVLFVADLEHSLRFYTESLGFKKQWQHDHEGSPLVVQVDRQGCEIILCLDAQRAGRARLFISLDDDQMQELKAEIAAKSVPANQAWWGYECLEVRDPDGNELLFPIAESNNQE